MQGSYFSLGGLNPLPKLDRLANPYRHAAIVSLRGGELTVRWTERADRMARTRGVPQPVLMQLYFACVVKKRVMFPDQPPPDAVEVSDRFLVQLSTAESDRCDPVTFARNHPAKRELEGRQAMQMRARELLIDCPAGEWKGEFSV